MIYTNVSDEIKSAITNELAASINAEPVLITRLSNHPKDDYLYLYVAKQKSDYVTGLANTSGKRVGLYENHYGCTFKRAMEIFTDKIWEA